MTDWGVGDLEGKKEENLPPQSDIHVPRRVGLTIPLVLLKSSS